MSVADGFVFSGDGPSFSLGLDKSHGVKRRSMPQVIGQFSLPTKGSLLKGSLFGYVGATRPLLCLVPSVRTSISGSGGAAGLVSPISRSQLTIPHETMRFPYGSPSTTKHSTVSRLSISRETQCIRFCSLVCVNIEETRLRSATSG